MAILGQGEAASSGGAQLVSCSSPQSVVPPSHHGCEPDLFIFNVSPGCSDPGQDDSSCNYLTAAGKTQLQHTTFKPFWDLTITKITPTGLLE